MKTQYWLISYVWRRYGSAEWTPANMEWKGSVGAALKDLKKYTESEHVIVAAMPISSADYKWMQDNL